MEKTKNIGIWIRVSTEMQVQDESPEHHEHRARMYAESKGWNVVTIYRLDAVSGKSVMEYFETKRMLADIKNGTISGIIFSKLARLARNTKELLEISELFRKSHADLISLAEAIDTSSPAGRLFFTIIAAMAQWEREEISDRVKASVPIRAQLGKPLGGQAPYGYKWENKELKIDETEAPIRRYIYEVFREERRIHSTTNKINLKGFRTRSGVSFTNTTIERLIRDTTAKGIRRANYSRSLGAGKKWELKSQEEWIEIPCEAIVDVELWEECNQILDAREKRPLKTARKTKYLLAGYISCSCGKMMYVYYDTPIYKCKPCKRKIPVQDIDDIYHQQLKHYLMTDTDVDTFNSKTALYIQEKETLLTVMKNEFDKLLKKTEELTNLRIGGELSKEEFARFYTPAEKQLRQIESQLPELEAEIDFKKIQSLSSDVVLQEAKDLYNNWSLLSIEDKRSIVETITKHIIIDEETIDISYDFLPAPTFSERAENIHTSVPVRLL
jgi:site-specific DNA recombinase